MVSRILNGRKVGDADRGPTMAIVKHLIVIVLATFALAMLLGYALAQGGSVGVASVATWAEFLSMSTPLAGIVLLSVEVMKRRAPGLVDGLRGNLVSLGVGVMWGLLFYVAPMFRMYETLMDSVVYGAVASVIASGFYDVALDPIKQALKSATSPRVVRMETLNAVAESLSQVDPFLASVARRDAPDRA
jgi:hypothetical protein